MMYTKNDNSLLINTFERQERKLFWRNKSKMKHRSVNTFEKIH